jgi:hypothetical protein
MTRRSKILLFGVAFLIVAVIVAILILQLSRNFREVVNLTDEQAKLILNKELPTGTSKIRVRQFLDRKNWPYSDFGPTVQTMIHDARHNGLIRTDIQIQFHFNSDDGLISYDIKDFFTGP